MKDNRTKLVLCALIGVAVISVGAFASAQGVKKTEPSGDEHWYFCPSFGVMDFEGDEEVNDGTIFGGRVGYDSLSWLSLESSLLIAPSLSERFVGNTEYTNGVPIYRDVSRSKKPGFGHTYAVAVAVDALYHFTRWDRLDPYITVGLGVTWYENEINGENFDPTFRGGAGVMWHFNDEWAVRGDWRSLMAGNDSEANSTIDAGIVWVPGARVAPRFVAEGGVADSDGDGLIDSDEVKWKTDMWDVDTDDDGLYDGPEVHKYKTNPLDPDTDGDMLKDGFDEVLKYKTDPLDVDSDDGGVTDGHEVLQDGTNPQAGHGDDDLYLEILDVKFDYDDDKIRPEWIPQLVKIGKVLQRHSDAKAKVEGHADRKQKSDKDYNQKLSERRAENVASWLARNYKVEKGRLGVKGFGFTWPKEKPIDLVKGNPPNRRVEIYISGVDRKSAAAAAAEPGDAPEGSAGQAEVAAPVKKDTPPESK